jgi:hypothetical protein
LELSPDPPFCFEDDTNVELWFGLLGKQADHKAHPLARVPRIPHSSLHTNETVKVTSECAMCKCDYVYV